MHRKAALKPFTCESRHIIITKREQPQYGDAPLIIYKNALRQAAAQGSLRSALPTCSPCVAFGSANIYINPWSHPLSPAAMAAFAALAAFGNAAAPPSAGGVSLQQQQRLQHCHFRRGSGVLFCAKCHFVPRFFLGAGSVLSFT